MVRNAQKMISRMFFIVGYFPHQGGGWGLNEVWKISTQFFFEGFPNEIYTAQEMILDFGILAKALSSPKMELF